MHWTQTKPAPFPFNLLRSLVSAARNPWEAPVNPATLRFPLIRAVPLMLALCLLVPGASSAASLKEMAQRLFPQATVDSIEPTPIPSLYEIRSGKSILYMDASGSYVFVGELFDFATRKNLTATKLSDLNSVKFDDLPLRLALRFGPENATKRLAVFDDVDCPYCRRFHEETLPRLLREGVAVYLFLYPIPALHPQSSVKSAAIWCSENRATALQAALQDTLVITTTPTCPTPLADIAKLAGKMGIDGTPTLLLDTGLRLDGFLAYEALMARWQSSARR